MGAAWLFDGLFPFERVMLTLGILLFPLAVIAFLYQMFKKAPVSPPLVLVVLAIGMIGFPRLQSISVGKDILGINFYERELQNDPQNSAARSQLTATLAKVATRATLLTSAESAAIVASGQFAINQTDRATQTLQHAEALNPAAPGIQALQRKITTLQELGTLTQQVQADPSDARARSALLQTLANASTLKLANPAAIAQVASAQVVAGQREQAAANARVALSIEPQQPLALQVHQMLRMQAAR